MAVRARPVIRRRSSGVTSWSCIGWLTSAVLVIGSFLLGATTLQEYRKFVQKDPAIERRFQMVRVDELSPDASYEVLKRLRPALEKHHSVHIHRRTLRAAVDLTVRYMPNRNLPDKAIDVLDQACARHRLRSLMMRKRDAKDTSNVDTDGDRSVTPHSVRKVISQIQFDAGERYYEHHYQAGLEPHVSPDYGATGGGRNSWDHSHMAASERAAWHRQKVRAANERLGPGLVRYIGLILIDEVPAGEAARRITGRNNEAACRAVGTEMLKEALKILIDHWGMEPKRRRA